VRTTLLGLGFASALIAVHPTPAQRTAVSRQQPANAAPFVVGVTSWNGAIQVLGRFDGNSWVNTWPHVDDPSLPVPRLVDVPAAWLGKPVPREWHVWGPDQTSFTRRVTQLRRGLGKGEGCDQPLVLVMDLPVGIPRRLFDGLVAVDTSREVDDVENVYSDGVQGLQLEPFVRSAVVASEGSVLRGDSEWPSDTRARVEIAPIRIESLTRPARSDSPFAVHFTATRRVEWDNSTIGLVVEGWIHAPGTGLWDPARVSVSDVTARQFRGEEDPGSALRALAIFPMASSAVWVMSAPGYEWVSFKFIEVTNASAREVLTTHGGGC
jgi:hypothetical protein